MLALKVFPTCLSDNSFCCNLDDLALRSRGCANSSGGSLLMRAVSLPVRPHRYYCMRSKEPI